MRLNFPTANVALALVSRNNGSMTPIPDVAWNRVSGFVRQHTHDLRNELNGLDLEAALLADIVSDPEARESVARMRSEIRKIAANLRSLSTKFVEARPSKLRLSAQELFLIWQDQLTELAGLEVEWASDLQAQHVEVDPGSVAMALREMLVNAHAFSIGSRLKANSRGDGGVIFELREPKREAIDPSDWGRAPLSSTRRGNYGLGLCTLLNVIEANGGTVAWKYDADTKELVTRLTFPESPEASSN